MRMWKLSTLTFAAVVLATAPATADEVKAKITAPMIMNLLSQPVEARETAYNESLRVGETTPAKPDAGAIGEILEDGSVRYGRTTITVRNPCPPGHIEGTPPPLPGRRK
jgi:hypothetical protein